MQINSINCNQRQQSFKAIRLNPVKCETEAKNLLQLLNSLPDDKVLMSIMEQERIDIRELPKSKALVIEIFNGILNSPEKIEAEAILKALCRRFKVHYRTVPDKNIV